MSCAMSFLWLKNGERPHFFVPISLVRKMGKGPISLGLDSSVGG